MWNIQCSFRNLDGIPEAAIRCSSNPVHALHHEIDIPQITHTIGCSASPLRVVELMWFI